MSARILKFKAAPPSPISTRMESFAKGHPVVVEIPVHLALRISDAAIWEQKTAEQFVLAMLEAAFPEKTGAA